MLEALQNSGLIPFLALAGGFIFGFLLRAVSGALRAKGKSALELAADAVAEASKTADKSDDASAAKSLAEARALKAQLDALADAIETSRAPVLHLKK